jgi:hypothetical protein
MTEPGEHIPDGRRPLLLPFVTTTEHGGPHEPASYAAGWEMGVLATVLDVTRPAALTQTILAANGPQADLVCMRHGYTATLRPLGDGRTELVAHTDAQDAWGTSTVSALTDGPGRT